MAAEGHGREDGAGGTPGDGAAAPGAAEAMGDGAAGREAEGEGGGGAAGESGTPGGGAAPREAASAGGEATGPEAGANGAPPRPESSGTPLEDVEKELIEARRAAQENLDRALRAQAEIENVRRRAERDLAHAHKFALERFVSELLPVKDSLELGLAASAEKGATTAGIAEGIELTLRMFEQAMEKFGIEPVDPAGDPFNPEFHQAMTMQESDTAASGTVLTVVQKGYRLNERLVRPAMVIVAK